MADGKWIAGLCPEMPALEAARIVLPTRLKSVLHYLPLAATAAHRDDEHVHHLRVASRRATASLRLFATAFPDKLVRPLRKRLRRLRRAAGSARDWDVFLHLVTSSPALRTKGAAPARDVLTGWAAARRRDAQAELAEVAAAEGPDLEELAGGFAETAFIHPNPEAAGTLGRLAAEHLTRLIRELAEMLSPAPRGYEDLHRLRIHGKRLRYSMEVFADCFAAPFREQYYPAVEAMQEVLGGITDAHVTREHLAEIRDHLRTFHPEDWRRYEKTVERLLREQQQRFPRECAKFMAWLRDWRRLAAEIEPGTLALSYGEAQGGARKVGR